MQKHTERSDPYPASDGLVARAINMPGPDGDARDPELPGIFSYDFVLFDFGERIGVTPQLGMLLNRAGLVQHPRPRLLRVGINGERTHVHKFPQTLIPKARFQKISRGNDRVQESVGIRLLASACSQMIDNRHPLLRRVTVLARQKIAFHHFNSCPVAVATREGFDRGHFTEGPNEATQVEESEIQQTTYEPGTNEAGCPCYQDKIIRPDNKSVALRLPHISALIGDELTLNRLEANKSQKLPQMIEKFH